MNGYNLEKGAVCIVTNNVKLPENFITSIIDVTYVVLCMEKCM